MAERPPNRRRGRLRPDDIVSAAVGLIDARGPAELTMRRLGSAMGVEAMAIYRYFPSRNELIDAVVDRIVAEAAAHPDVQVRRDDDWRDYLDRLAHGVRRMALAHPRAFPLVASHPTQAPWIRPPLRSVQWVDALLEALQDHHFPPPAAVSVYKQFCTFLLGHLLLEVAALGLDHPPEISAPAAPHDEDAAAADEIRRRSAQQAETATGDDAPSAAQIADPSRHRPRTLAEEPALAASGVLAAITRTGGTDDGPGSGSEAGSSDTSGGVPASDPEAVELDADLPVTAAVVSTAGLDLAELPHVQASAGLLAEDTFARDFDRHLDWLLDEVARLRRA